MPQTVYIGKILVQSRLLIRILGRVIAPVAKTTPISAKPQRQNTQTSNRTTRAENAIFTYHGVAYVVHQPTYRELQQKMRRLYQRANTRQIEQAVHIVGCD